MKYIAKMMLALLASVSLIAPAYAWDFKASGSMEATFNSTSYKKTKDGNSVTAGGFDSDGGSIVLSSSHSEGDHSATFKYTADWDGNLDQLLNVSGTKKVGKWTGSASVEYNIGETGTGQQQTGADKGGISLTDGSMTIKLGEHGHLANQNTSSNSSAGASKTMESADYDGGIGAMVGSFHGVSYGQKLGDTMSFTVAYQNSGQASDLLGGMDWIDGETAAYGGSGFGVSLSLAAGPASIGATVGSASTKDNSGAGGSLKTSASALGVGVKIDMGDMKPFLNFGSNTIKGDSTGSERSHGGLDLGLTYAMGSDTVIVYFGNLDEKNGADDEPTKYTMLELGYNTTVGPASLKLGYGSRTTADADSSATNSADGYADGGTYSDIDVTMSMSF
jgi:hypothetical protein